MWHWLLAVLSWAHLQIIEPIVRWWEEVVLGSWEEWLLALVRQGFEETTRFLNGLGAWFLSLFNQHSYRDQLRRTWQENSWQQWWGEVATRPSTLNALVANLVAQQEQQQQQKHGQEKKPCTNGSDHASQPLDSTGSAVNPSIAADVPPKAATNGPLPGSVSAPPAAAVSQGQGQATQWWPGRQGMYDKQLDRRCTGSGGQLQKARTERPAVFVQQSGMGIIDELAKRRHGLIEDAKMAAQLAVSRAFEIVRTTVRAVFFLPSRESLHQKQQMRSNRREVDSAASSGADSSAHGGTQEPASGAGGSGGGVAAAARYRREGPASAGCGAARSTVHKAHLQRSKSAHVNIAELAYKPGAGAGSASVKMSRRGLRRSQSYGYLNRGASAFANHTADTPSDALSVIRAAGYPHELHVVTTADGYVLRMERIPRAGARDVVFFMHGVLDTSMAWVSGGVTGSQAFAAWEAGFDVWLGNSRGNAPRQHQDPACRGRRYWQYNINHMGMYDIAAQLDHVHNTKCAELGAGTVTLDLDHLGPLAGSLLGGGAHGGNGPSSLLPGRAASALGDQRQGLGSAQASAARGRTRGASRMRPSNSDGNLFRWGSSNSASNSTCNGGGGSPPGPGPAAAPAPAPDGWAASAGTEGAQHGSPDPNSELYPENRAVGTSFAAGGYPSLPPEPTASAPASEPTEAASSLATTCSPCGWNCTALAASDRHHANGIGACRERLLAPACAGAALRGRQDGAGKAVVRAVSCGPRLSLSMDSEDDEDGDEDGCSSSGSGSSGGGAASSQGAAQSAQQLTRREALAGPNQDTAALAGPSSSPLSRCRPPLSSPARGTGTSLPGTPVRQNAVTLTVMSPGGPVPGAAEDGGAGGPAAPQPTTTTFTLEVKTRTDFHPALSAPSPYSNTAPSTNTVPAALGGSASPPVGSRKPAGHTAAGADGTAAAAPAAAATTAAGGVLDAMGSILGPAADAVTAAVASAAASAGAALATAASAAAVSASQLLHPSPHRPGAHPAGAGAIGPTASPHTASRSLFSPTTAVDEAGAGAVALPELVDVEQCGGSGADCYAAAVGVGNVSDAGPLGVTSTAAAAGNTALRAGSGVVSPAAPAAPAAAAGTSFRRVHSTDQLAGGGYFQHRHRLQSAFASAADLPDQAGSGPLPLPLPLSRVGTGGSSSSSAANGLPAPGIRGNPSPAGSRRSGSSSSSTLGGAHLLPPQLAEEPVGRGVSSVGGAARLGGSGGDGRRQAGAAAGGPGADASAAPPPPYKLRCVAHSLGGMSVLIHLVNRLREGRPHNVSRLLLLTPAGFHRHHPRVARPIMWLLPAITRLLRAVFGRTFAFPLYIPTPLARALTFKLLLSASRIPGLGELLRTCYKAMLDGDISQWDRALQMPQYSAEDMPATSVDQVLHLIQLVASDSFQLYDYGSPAANVAHYGALSPPDVSSEYWRLDLPVHLVAGRRDGVIPQPNILRHLEAMRAQGVAVSYREFDFGHLDFTFGVKEELRMYMMKVLKLQ